jgi:hypothetical protein
MPTTETKLRRDTSTNITAATPADGEPFYDQTNKRLGVGDGTTAGGIPHASAADVQKQSFKYASAGGTANALTLTLAPALAAYAAGVTTVFKATANNTGSATININGLGTRNLRKMLDGALTTLAADDIVSGGIYELYDDGTQMQLINPSPRSASAGSFVLLSTQTASSSASIVFTSLLSSSYDSYEIHITNLLAASGTNALLGMRMSTNNGSSYDSGASYQHGASSLPWTPGSPTQANNASNGSVAGLWLHNPNISNSTSIATSLIVDLLNVNSAANYKDVISRGIIAGAHTSTLMGQYRSSTVVNAIEFKLYSASFAGSGNISTGTFRLYGKKNT